jgi:hypothetical protein
MKQVFIIIISLFSLNIFPQELNCRIDVDYSGLPMINREILAEFKGTIEDYMNRTRFTTDTWEGPKIDCSISIFFLNVAHEVNYTAQAVITSQRPIYRTKENSLMLSINDNSWQFRYERGQQLYGSPGIFDPLTSFLDFYAFIIIGFDMDSYDEFGGQQHFSRAYDIVNLGGASRAPGWERSSSSYNRRGLVDNLLNERYAPFRKAYFDYHYNGIDLYPRDPSKAQERIVTMIKVLDGMRNKIDFNSVLLKTFFDAKHGEIIDRLRGYPDKDIYRLLKRVDPARISKYDEAMSL